LGESLGTTPKEVASKLAAYGVAGRQGDAANCAIARYMGAIIGTEPGVRAISVFDRSIRVTLTPGHLPVVVRLPRPIAKFVRAFDSGCYPELVAGSDLQAANDPETAKPVEAEPVSRPSRMGNQSGIIRTGRR
jgi:hypothetical protein